MITTTEKQISIVEEDVCFSSPDYDIQNIHPGHKMPIWWNTETYSEIDVNDFIGWMYETGRIDNYHTEGDGLVEIGDDYHEYDIRRHDYICTKRGTFHYTFHQFFRDCVTDRDLLTYKTCQQ